jgi:hypothetical protein
MAIFRSSYQAIYLDTVVFWWTIALSAMTHLYLSIQKLKENSLSLSVLHFHPQLQVVNELAIFVLCVQEGQGPRVGGQGQGGAPRGS